MSEPVWREKYHGNVLCNHVGMWEDHPALNGKPVWRICINCGQIEEQVLPKGEPA